MKKSPLFWVPRIIVMLGIVLVMAFSFDVFEGNDPSGAKLLALLVHNIPALALGASLVIAWLWELAGGVLYVGLFIASCFLLRPFPGYPLNLLVIAPFLAAGILFIIHYFKTRKSR
jgi:hypothetical protein